LPLDWALTQNSLGLALAALGEREGGIKRLEEAIAAYDAALSVVALDEGSHEIENVNKNRTRASALLASRQHLGR